MLAKICEHYRERADSCDHGIGVVGLRMVGLSGVRMHLRDELLPMFVEPSVQFVKRVAAHLHVETAAPTVRMLMGNVHMLNVD